MSVDQLVQRGLALGLERLDAQLLLLHVLGRRGAGRGWLLAHGQDYVGPALEQAFDTAAGRRRAGEPLAYITGHREFYGLDLQVDARVLDPRADTETLVDWALELLPPAAHAMDLGAGSGAIALAIKHQRSDVRMEARDFSADALAVARDNAQRLNLAIDFSQGFWLDGMIGPFDLIVSNPPYIAAADPHLAALVHEPLQALASGIDGLADLRTIVAQAPPCLKPGGWLLLEHGYDQAQAVRNLFLAQGFIEVLSRRDMAGQERCSAGRLRAA
jgi:release factor glutamine methyltransferase